MSGAPTPDELRLTVAAVARRLGVAPATLRTWDRRYGLGPSGHAPGAHRRYSAGDVARLEAMCRHTQAGVPPAEAARRVLSEATALPPAVPTAAPRRTASGGRVLGLPDGDAALRGLARAAMALDDRSLRESIRGALAERGVVATWEALVRPLLVAIGERWAARDECVEVEHLVSEVVLGELRRVTAGAAASAAGTPLLTCAANETHSLPLHALAAALAGRGVACRVLGGGLPAEALAAAVRRTGPPAIVVWAQDPATADPEFLAALPRTRPAPRLFLGGPGWTEPLPPRAELLTDLATATDRLTQLLIAEGS